MFLVILTPQRLYGLLARFLLGEMLVITAYGVGPQDSIGAELAPPLWEVRCVSVAFV